MAKKRVDTEKNDLLSVAAQAAFQIMRDNGQPPAALALMVMMPEGRLIIVDGGSRDGLGALADEAPSAVSKWASDVVEAHRKESH